jgi:predicted SAM-dependent methyltransferase
MLNIDVGGLKGKRDLNGKWKILDCGSKADYVHDLNSSVPLPFANNTVDNIYCSNTLEHVEPDNITFVLSEFHRILKVGGKCRIVVPDTSYAINLYLNNPNELANGKYCNKLDCIPPTPMGYLTSWFHTNKNRKSTGHKIGFDKDLLIAFIKTTNFNKIEIMKYNKCSAIFEQKDYERYEGWNIFLEVTKE